MSVTGGQFPEEQQWKRRRIDQVSVDRDTSKEMIRCDRCASKNKKCDGPRVVPCASCKKRGVDCVYGGRVPIDEKYVRWLEEKVVSLAQAKGIRIEKNGTDSEASPSRRVDAPAPEEVATMEPAPERVSPYFVKHETQTPTQRASNEPMPGPVASKDHSRDGQRVAEHDKPSTDLPPPKVGTAANGIDLGSSRSYYPQCRPFVNNFFSSVDHIYPILDGKQEFLKRCEALWASQRFSGKPSFVPLYYSVLCLGALIGQRDQERIEGQSNLTWFTRLFTIAKIQSRDMELVADLNLVQCYFFMALVCQHTMKPQWAYMYLGLACRTALAMGLNQNLPRTRTQDPNITEAETRTWWAVYTLESEMSICMRRPTALGPDIFHNRPFQKADVSGTIPETARFHGDPRRAIIWTQVAYARLLRRVCMELYMTVGRSAYATSPVNKPSLQVSMLTAASIEQDADKWLARLPAAIRPDRGASHSLSLKLVKELPYIQAQKMILTIKNHNLRMLLFAFFLLRSYDTAEEIAIAKQCFQNCLASARYTINVTYDAYKNHEWFRTWYHNCTYIIFAASVILTYMSQRATTQEKEQHRRYVEKALEILEVMDESSAATQGVNLIKRAVQQPPFPNLRCDQGFWIPGVFYWGGLDLMNEGYDANFLRQLGVMP